MICILINFNSRKQVITMKVILMNQNIKVLLAEMDENNTFQKIYEYYDTMLITKIKMY